MHWRLILGLGLLFACLFLTVALLYGGRLFPARAPRNIATTSGTQIALDGSTSYSVDVTVAVDHTVNWPAACVILACGVSGLVLVILACVASTK